MIQSNIAPFYKKDTSYIIDIESEKLLVLIVFKNKEKEVIFRERSNAMLSKDFVSR